MSCLATGGAADYNAPHGAVPKWLREQSAKLRCSGSNPLGASKVFLCCPSLRKGPLGVAGLNLELVVNFKIIGLTSLNFCRNFLEIR